jgi:hypothetical protein
LSRGNVMRMDAVGLDEELGAEMMATRLAYFVRYQMRRASQESRRGIYPDLPTDSSSLLL